MSTKYMSIYFHLYKNGAQLINDCFIVI